MAYGHRVLRCTSVRTGACCSYGPILWTYQQEAGSLKHRKDYGQDCL